MLTLPGSSISAGRLLIIDFLSVTAAYIVAFYLVIPADIGVYPYLRYDGGYVGLLLAVLAIVISLRFCTRDNLPIPVLGLAQQIALVIGIAFFTQGIASYISHARFRLPVRVMLAGSLFAAFAIFCLRIAVRLLARIRARDQRYEVL